MFINLYSYQQLLVLINTFVIILTKSPNYCDPKLCELWNGTSFVISPHIACGNSNENFSDKCAKDVSMVKITQNKIDLILNMHNRARNLIASGKINGYSEAENMPILKWDADLEYLAQLHVKLCQFEHDPCHNTNKYEFVGQNIGLSWSKPPFHSNSKRIKLIISLWFKEYKDANQSFIDEYRNHPGKKKIGHFTTIVNNKVKRIGCAAVSFSDSMKGKVFLMTCNYDYGNIFTEPVYNAGPAASKCPLHTSLIFPALCEWEEDEMQYQESVESQENEDILSQF